MPRRHWWFILTLPACLLLAIRFFPPPPPTGGPYHPLDWTLADVRALDPADAAQPTHDLLAVYLRQSGNVPTIRIDLLEHAGLPDYDAYIALDSTPGGTRRLPIADRADLDWELLLQIPAVGDLRLLGPDFQPVPGGFSVLRDPQLDTLTIYLSGIHLPLAPRLQVFLTAAGSPQAVDRSAPTSVEPAAIRPAPVLMAFTNSFPAYTPATALRRWSGAHTGPMGGSHGLAHLLRVAREAQVPLLLADLRAPAALSALEIVGGLPLVQEMTADGLLILPEPVFDQPQTDTFTEPAQEARIWNRGVAAQFGLPATGFLTGPPSAAAGGAAPPLVFIQHAYRGRLQVPAAAEPAPIEPAVLQRRGASAVLALPDFADPQQARMDGPSATVRTAISAAALIANQEAALSTVLILGGELPDSAWGAPGPARATLHYLRSRPWIQFLNATDLLSLPAAENPPHAQSGSEDMAQAAAGGSPFRPHLSADAQAQLLSELQTAPDNSLRLAAWQAYWSLYAPVYPPADQLPELRSGYVGGIRSLLAGARWAQNPVDGARCETDVDLDGQAECVLSNESWYVQIDPASGALTHVFSRDANGVHQWIAPSAQFITGLSDPQTWNLSSGLAVDPGVIPGAFSEPSQSYRVRVQPDGLLFETPDGQARKDYRLTPTEMIVRYTAASQFPFPSIGVPLAPDPWQRFTRGWVQAYRLQQSNMKIAIAAPGQANFGFQVESSSNLAVDAFNDTSQFTLRPENPDRAYPPGHYLPFPMFQIEIPTLGQTQVMIKLTIAEQPLR